MFHPIGDPCPYGVNSDLADFIANKTNTQVKCIESKVHLPFDIDLQGIEDWITNMETQAQMACENIKKEEIFQNDFSIIGLSHGGLIARYIIEKCDMPGRVKRFVSVGGPQMGVAKIPFCDYFFCYPFNKIASDLAYFTIPQYFFGPTGYFRDINNYDNYLKYSTFLADINNEKAVKNSFYKQRFSELEKLVLISFAQDGMILPKQTAWFESYNEKGEIEALKESKFYKDDFIGLRYLDEQKRVDFVELPGNHIQFTNDDVEKYMIPAFK